MFPYPKVEQVGSQWFYWLSAWEAAKGPFEDSHAAYDAMQAELQTRHGW